MGDDLFTCLGIKDMNMRRLREAGFEFVAMSSVGPAVAIITDRTEEEMQAIR